MIKDFLTMYRPGFTNSIVYMLQSVEYEPSSYLRWLIGVNNFNNVMYRKQLVLTKPAKALLMFLRLGISLQLLMGLIIFYKGYNNSNSQMAVIAVVVVAAAPILWAYLVVIPLLTGRWLIIKPSNFTKVHVTKALFSGHPAIKIAVAGSYGKTTMKEMLATVLAEGKKVAATPANKNVAISHARFAEKLEGQEDVLIIEYGEGKPGDVKRFSKITKPDWAIITGIAPAHLDKYKTLDKAAKDIFSVSDYAGAQNTFVNGDSPDALSYSVKSNKIYNQTGLGEWQVKDLKSNLEGLKFKLTNGHQTIMVRSGLLGKHQVGPLVAVAMIARELGLSTVEIEKGLSKITAFEHRMKPYQLSGAWIIDDTYNGNIEGARAGLELLKELPAKRKTYVTPGLVDQGPLEAKVHKQLGESIKLAAPDRTVLIAHSVLPYILEGLDGYKGELIIEEDPLNFYTNLDKMVAAGDLVLLQNDWPDNYK